MKIVFERYRLKHPWSKTKATISIYVAPFVKLSLLVVCVKALSFSALAQTTTNENSLNLVGNIVPTLIDTDDKPARAIELVKLILKDSAVDVTATTQAWSGSGLRSGKFVGFIDHYSLNNERANYIYSEPYLSIPLHVASKNNKNLDVTRLDKIYRQSVGVENRFANTDYLRSERSVRWARSPDFIGIVQQLVDRRTQFIIADKLMLNEVNKMVLAENQESLTISSSPIKNVDLKLAINSNYPMAREVINEFNTNLVIMKESGAYQEFVDSFDNVSVLLDQALYEEILRKW